MSGQRHATAALPLGRQQGIYGKRSCVVFRDSFLFLQKKTHKFVHTFFFDVSILVPLNGSVLFSYIQAEHENIHNLTQFENSRYFFTTPQVSWTRASRFLAMCLMSQTFSKTQWVARGIASTCKEHHKRKCKPRHTPMLGEKLE